MGRMWVQRRITPYPGEPWGFDNGAFAAWRTGQEFPKTKYLQRLEAARQLGRPQLAVVPDLVADAASLRYSLAWRVRLPNDWPWYPALQDGMVPAEVATVVGRFAGIFLGGSDRLKRKAAMWASFARDHGVAFHYGRASTFQRLEQAIAISATSADTTNFMWTKVKWRRLVDWWDDSRVNQHGLFPALTS